MASHNYSDWTKIFNIGDFKAPVNPEQAIAYFRRNAETGSTVMQIFTESAQAIARRQAEILRSNAEHALKASKDLLNHSSSPETAASKQADFAKTWMEFNVNSLRELSELSAKSTKEAFNVIQKRVAEQVQEFSDAAGSAATSTKKKAAA